MRSEDAVYLEFQIVASLGADDETLWAEFSAVDDAFDHAHGLSGAHSLEQVELGVLFRTCRLRPVIR